jgi:hypothetical protein
MRKRVVVAVLAVLALLDDGNVPGVAALFEG